MNITINGVSETVEEMTLADLCKRFNDHPHFIATAVNGVFVAVTSRGSHKLKDGDKIEIVSPRQGG